MNSRNITASDREWGWWVFPRNGVLGNNILIPLELSGDLKGNAFEVIVILLLHEPNQKIKLQENHRWRVYSRRGLIGSSIKVPVGIKGKVKGAVFAVKVRRLL